MKNSLLEDFSAQIKKSNKRKGILSIIGVSLSIAVFLGVNMFVSQNAIAEEIENMDKIERSSDIIQLQDDTNQANQVYQVDADTIINTETYPPAFVADNLLGNISNTIGVPGPYELTEKNISNVEVQWDNGEGYEVLTNQKIEIGDSIKLKVDYFISDNELQENENTITYQLPVGIKTVSDDVVSGAVEIGGEEVGHYTIDQEGLATLTFNDDFAYTEAFKGSINFIGEIGGEEIAPGDTIKITEGCTITLKDAPVIDYGISECSKEGTLKAGVVEYVVTVNSENGTESDVFISDILKTGKGRLDGTYNEDSFVITKTGTTEEVPVKSLLISNNAEPPSRFDMTLPQLAAGGSYTIKYSVTPKDYPDNPNPDGITTIGNDVTATSGTGASDFVSTTIKGKTLEKKGAYNKNSGVITWTVTLRPGPGGLSGYTLKDTMTAAGETYEKFDNVTLKDATQNKVIAHGISLPYEFDDTFDENHIYTVTYTTKIEDILADNMSGAVNNTAVLEKNNEVQYTVTSKGISASNTTYALKKTSAGVTDSTYSWESIITIPDGGEISKAMTYEDTLADLSPKISGFKQRVHFTTVASLKALTVTMGNRTATAGTDYTILGYNQDTKQTYNYETLVSLPDDDDTQLHNFSLTFTSTFLEEYKGKKLSIQYDTYINPEGLTPGTSYSVKNTGKIGSKSVSATTPYQADCKFSKLVSTDQKGTYAEEYEDIPYNSLLEDGTPVLYYQITLEPARYGETLPTWVDTLPDNAEFIELVDVKYKRTDNKLFDWNENVSAAECIDIEKGSGTITISMTEKAKNVDWKSYDLQIGYKIALPASESWDKKDPEREFINALTDGEKTVNATATVVDTTGYLSKAGKQETITDKDNEVKYTSKAQYSLIINQSESNLNMSEEEEPSGTIELVDTMDTGSSFVTADLDEESIKLYSYEGGKKGKLVQDYTCVQEEEGNQHIIRMTIPDDRALLLEYTYNIYNNASGEVNLTNSANLEGLQKTESDSVFTFEKGSYSAAVVMQDKATIYKHELNKVQIPLKDAEFKIERYDENNPDSWQMVTETISTKANGKIQLSFEGDTYIKDTLFRIIETKAPDRYMLDDSPRYFVWLDQKGINGIAKPDDIVTEDITIFSQTTAELKIPNDLATSIRVQKKWYESSGELMETPPDIPVNCELIQLLEGEEPTVVKELTLSATDGWEATYDLVPYRTNGTYLENELPQKDAAGNQYFYSVREIAVPEGYDVTYSTEIKKGLEKGDLTIENTKITYVLPETGGVGPAIPLILGAIITTLATAILLLSKKKTQ